MKKTVLLLFLFLFLFGCSIPSVPTETQTPEPTSEVTPIPEPTPVSVNEYFMHDGINGGSTIVKESIYENALKAEKHSLALHSFKSPAEIDEFVRNYCENTVEENFLKQIERYDEEFFTENTLFVLWLRNGCSDTKYSLDHVTIENSKMTLYPYVLTEGVIETEGHFYLILPMKDELLKDVSQYDVQFLKW